MDRKAMVGEAVCPQISDIKDLPKGVGKSGTIDVQGEFRDNPASATGQTWAETVAALMSRLGREPTLDELLSLAAGHKMTPAEIQAQRESWTRAMRPTGDPSFD